MHAAMIVLQSTESASEPLSLEACYALHHPKIYRLGLRYSGGNGAWAEDLTHDVFVRFAEKYETLDTASDVGGWLYRVASNLAISKLRRERSLWGRVATLLRAEPGSTAPGVDVTFEQQELAQAAVRTLERLPPKERIAFSMKVLDDKSQKEIAEVLSMSEGYVSKLISRASARIERQGWEVAP